MIIKHNENTLQVRYENIQKQAQEVLSLKVVCFVFYTGKKTLINTNFYAHILIVIFFTVIFADNFFTFLRPDCTFQSHNLFFRNNINRV